MKPLHASASAHILAKFLFRLFEIANRRTNERAKISRSAMGMLQ